jgi:tetratricopeptide (TPR) repeat protein
MRILLALAALTFAAPAAAQLSISTFGATDAQGCYEDARSETATSTDRCDAALRGPPMTKRDRLATLVNRGIIYNRAGRIDAALADFNAALEGDAALGEAWLNRGNAQFLLGKYQLAIADYEKSLETDVSKPWIAWYNIGLAREALKDARGARTAYERALAINPEFGLARKKLGPAE